MLLSRISMPILALVGSFDVFAELSHMACKLNSKQDLGFQNVKDCACQPRSKILSHTLEILVAGYCRN